jgi:tRNA dimethylallyltransferase
VVDQVIAIFGPTASGKSAVAEEIARRIPAELVSADSMQAYRGLPVLTNQSEARLVGIWELDHEGSLGEYQELAHAAVDEILAAGRTPVVVGGTGLYLRAALSELELPPAPERGTRERLERLYDELGGERAHELLADRDPAAAASVHPNDRRRVVRALELAAVGSSLAPARDTLWSDELRRPTVLVGLDLPDDVLDARIAARVDAMVARGVQAEARAAWSRPLSATARKVLGLEEFATLPLPDAAAAVVAATRRLARYQRKWLRRLPVAATLAADREPEEIADEIVALAGAGERLPRR